MSGITVSDEFNNMLLKSIEPGFGATPENDLSTEEDKQALLNAVEFGSSVTKMAESDNSFQERQDYSSLFGVLNENKLMYIFEEAVCKKYGEWVSEYDLNKYTDYLNSELSLIEKFVISNLELKGISVPQDPKHWARNKLRIDWSERLCSSWARAGEDGINALKERVPAIVALSIRYGSNTGYLEKEPFNSPSSLTIRNGIDDVAAKALLLAQDIEQSIQQAEVVKIIMTNIIYLADGLKKDLLENAGIEPDSNQEKFIFLNSLKRVSGLYENGLRRNVSANKDLDSIGCIEITNKEVRLFINSQSEVREKVIEETASQVKAMSSAKKVAP